MGRRKNKNQSKIETVDFKYIWNQAVTSVTYGSPTLTTITVNPTLDPRIDALAAYWQFYRFVKLVLTIYPGGSNATSSLAVENYSIAGWNPRVPNTPPSTFPGVMELSKSTVNPWRSTDPSTLVLTRKDLLQDVPLKWYQTKAGTEDAQWENQGVIYLASIAIAAATSTVTMQYGLSGTVEFMGRSLDIVTPLKDRSDPLKVSSDNNSIHNSPVEESIPGILVVGGVTYKKSQA